MSGDALDGSGLSGARRVGDTVRRATGPWTPTVHALLRHLAGAGFAAAPTARGVDEQGREVLDWVEGDVQPGHGDAPLAAFGRLVRELHDATVDFRPPGEPAWQVMVGAPTSGEVVCHNDLAPLNTVLRPDGSLVLLDWDLAAPGPRVWDLAWAAYRWVPLYDDATCKRLGITTRPQGPRLRLLADAYGLDAGTRRDLLPTVADRLSCLVETARAWGTEGRPGWRDVWRDTGGRQWVAGLAHVRARTAAWSRWL